MKIRVEVDHPDVVAVLSSMEPRDYYVMGTYAKGPEQIALIKITNQTWRDWIEQHQPKWILK